MNILFMDTETTGIPKNYKAPPSDVSNWPRLVQVGWIFGDNKQEYIIRPTDFTIPVDASNIHGVTQEKALAEGVHIHGVLEEIKGLVRTADIVAGHNISFDTKIVGAEFYREFGKDFFDGKRTVCTMLKSIDFCALPGKYGFKYPKLSELYLKLFGRDMGAAHTALMDIENTKECFDEMVKRGLIKL